MSTTTATDLTIPRQRPARVRHRFTELDGLRGAAALVVVIFHLRRQLRDLDPPGQLDLLVSGGYLMVDLFFVLSGFVLARSMLATGTPRDVLRFGSLRARRFLPLHLTGMAVVLAGVVLTWLVQLYGYDHAPGRPAFSTAQESPWGYLSAALLIQGFVGPHLAGYAAAWSLSIELWTNLLLVAAIAALPWANRRQWVGPAALGLGVLVLFTLGRDGENTLGWTAFGRGLAGLGAGMTLYAIHTWIQRHCRDRPQQHCRDRHPSWSWPSIGAVLGLLALAACMYFARDLRELRFVPVLLVAAVLILCLVQPADGPAHRVLNSRLLQWLGSRSFALYALHGAALTTVKLAGRLYGMDLDAPKAAVFIIVTGLIAALAAAEVGHRFIERAWLPKNQG